MIALNFPEMTAVFACADMMAFGVIKSLLEAGRRVPDDVSVIGFDDIFMSKMFIPPLTTVRQNIAEKGIIAAEHLINLIASGGESEAEEIVLPLRIVERQTVKRKA
jgi:LacI family transcriptional regulator